MSSTYNDLLLQLMGDAGDVHPPELERVFRRSLCAFMETAQVWRTRYSSDLAAATPDPTTRDALIAAYEVAQAAADAAPSNLTLAQAAADAYAAAYASPVLTLTRPLKTAAIVSPPTPAVYYTAYVNPAMNVTVGGQNASPWWRIEQPTVAGGAQTLVLIPPLAYEGHGVVQATLVWVPVFDADTSLACPGWVYERYGGIISDWTIGQLWIRGMGRKSNAKIGMQLRSEAMIAAQRERTRQNHQDPIPISV